MDTNIITGAVTIQVGGLALSSQSVASLNAERQLHSLPVLTSPPVSSDVNEAVALYVTDVAALNSTLEARDATITSWRAVALLGQAVQTNSQYVQVFVWADAVRRCYVLIAASSGQYQYDVSVGGVETGLSAIFGQGDPGQYLLTVPADAGPVDFIMPNDDSGSLRGL